MAMLVVRDLTHTSVTCAQVLQIMLPLRLDLCQMGGSWAQRQVFNSTMIEAAVRADKLPVAVGLVAELVARKPQNQRLRKLLAELKASLHHKTTTTASSASST